MNAPLRAVYVCHRGHGFRGDACSHCKRIEDAAESRARSEQERAAVAAHWALLRDAKLAATPSRTAAIEARVAADPEGSVCGIHANTGVTCERCRLAHAANAKALAETTPWHERVRAHTYKRGVIGTFRHAIPTHDKAVFE
jgi:hypothetical protein